MRAEPRVWDTKKRLLASIDRAHELLLGVALEGVAWRSGGAALPGAVLVASADKVLVNKLKSLSNVDILVNAQTTEITGDGSRVAGLTWKDRASGQRRERTEWHRVVRAT